MYKLLLLSNRGMIVDIVRIHPRDPMDLTMERIKELKAEKEHSDRFALCSMGTYEKMLGFSRLLSVVADIKIDILLGGMDPSAFTVLSRKPREDVA